MVSSEQTRVTRQVQASLHPQTGNLRLSLYSERSGWVFYFFDGRAEAVRFLEEALDLVDPQENENDQ